MKRILSLAAVLILGGTALAQRPVPVVAPRNLNPYVLQATTPRYSWYVPPRVSPPVWGYSPWVGPVMYPGAYRPPRVVTTVPGRYYNVPGLGMYNPWSGSIYQPYTNSFTTRDGIYSYNPWTGTYTNPLNGGSYNPWRGTVSTPAFLANPWGW